jgi:hypothetical protein
MDRFELEDAIMACWHTADDLKLVTKQILEGDGDKDNLANALIGIQELHNLRCQRVFDIFSALVESGAIK